LLQLQILLSLHVSEVISYGSSSIITHHLGCIGYLMMIVFFTFKA